MTDTPTRRSAVARLVAACAATVFAVRPAWPGQPRQHVVEITGFQFTPGKLKVRAGDTVTWINRDIAPHTATAEDGSWDTEQIDKDQQKSVMISKKSQQAYFCRFHPVMKARLLIDTA